MNDAVSIWPDSGSKTTCSSSAWPMPWASPPCTWPERQHRIDQPAVVIDRRVAIEPHDAGLRVDLDLRDLAAIGEA